MSIFYLFVHIHYKYWFLFSIKKNFWHFHKIWWELLSGSLLNQSQTYQGNPCGVYSDLSSFTESGVYPDLSSFTGSGVIQKTLQPVSSDLLLVRFTSACSFKSYDLRIPIHSIHTIDHSGQSTNTQFQHQHQTTAYNQFTVQSCFRTSYQTTTTTN